MQPISEPINEKNKYEIRLYENKDYIEWKEERISAGKEWNERYERYLYCFFHIRYKGNCLFTFYSSNFDY